MKRRLKRRLTRIGESLRVVLNASPLIVLAELGVLEDAVGELFVEAEVPCGVLAELGRKKDEVFYAVMDLVRRELLRIEEVSRSFPRLGLGESSAILVALEKGKVVVLDDKRARRLARELGLEVIGTLSVLRRLYEIGALKMSREQLYIRLLNMGFYVRKHVFDKVFAKD